MKRAVFSFSIDLLLIAIIMVLMFLVVNLSVENIDRSQEAKADTLLNSYEQFSSALVMVLSDDVPDGQEMCECVNGRSVSDNQPCPTKLVGIKVDNTVRGIR